MSSELRTRTRAAKRQAFVDAACGIVEIGGTDALTMQQVADELGCGVGSIYRYFASKEELLDAVHAEHVRTLTALLPPAPADAPEGPDALARLIGLGRTWVRAGHRHPAEVRTVRRLVTAGDPAVGGIAERFTDAIGDAVAAGLLVPGDEPARVRVLLAAIGDASLVADDELLGDQLLTCLLVAWGADPHALDGAPS